MGGYDFKRFADPVHDTVGLSELEVRVINSSVFQRLRGVKQLGLAHYVFPSLDYSRFAHSVGVCHVTGLILEAVCRAANVELSAEETQLYRLAGLVHDIGHYPFSHAMEEAIEEHYGETSLLIPLFYHQVLYIVKHFAACRSGRCGASCRGA